ncbi:MAG: hypothetical protein PSY14_10215 [bacterium]|nr:hypothetical protein [bacterium]
MELRALRLDPAGQDSAEVLQLNDIRAALLQGTRVVLEGPAGRGKTTTLIQLAKAHAGAGGIPFLIDLTAWTASRSGILQFIAGMPQFQSRLLDAASLARVNTAEHFSFLLNGWNEIGEPEFPHAESALRTLERDFPAAGIIVATRTHHIVPPLWKQLEDAFVERRPHGESSNTFTLEPRSSNAIRARLLEMATKDDRRKQSALKLLGQIEEWRLKYGRPAGEPRHPAFDSGEPWPPNGIELAA